MLIFLPESSRYLLYKQKYLKLIDTFNDMCKQNGKHFEVVFKGNNDGNDQEANKSPEKPRKSVSICRDLMIRKAATTLPLMLIWLFPALGSGVFVFLPEIMLMQGYDMSEIYLLTGFTMIVPIVGVFLSSMFIDAFGRKQLIAMCSLISGFSLCTFMTLPENKIEIITYYGVFGSYALFMRVQKNVTAAYTPELYSTSTRTSAMGMMSAIDKFTGILQPVIFTSLIYYSFQLAMATFGV